MTMEDLDVAIAGGGPGGLAAAAALTTAFDGKLRVRVQCLCTTIPYISHFCGLSHRSFLLITAICTGSEIV